MVSFIFPRENFDGAFKTGDKYIEYTFNTEYTQALKLIFDVQHEFIKKTVHQRT